MIDHIIYTTSEKFFKNKKIITAEKNFGGKETRTEKCQCNSS